MASKRSLQSYQLAYFRRLNDIHIAAQVTVAALERSKDNLYAEAVEGNRFQHFEVASGNKPTARIRRQRLDMDVLVTRIMNRTEYENALVVAVSLIEDYILNLLRVMLLAHPDNVKIAG